MSGWKLLSVKGNQSFSFPSGFIPKAGTGVKVVSGKGDGDGATVLKWTSKNIWNNDGDPGKLYDNTGNLFLQNKDGCFISEVGY